MSDSYQTRKGMYLWYNIIDLAFAAKHSVYVLRNCKRMKIDEMQANAYVVLDTQATAVKKHAWSHSNSVDVDYSELRILISKGNI